jgi:hypothetical protein
MVWEFIVMNPPKTQEESELLAWEQLGFCSDIVWQGEGTVNLLAGTLIHSSLLVLLVGLKCNKLRKQKPD